MARLDDLRRITDDALIDGMPANLRHRITLMLRDGADPKEIVASARRQCGGRRGLALAVEALVERLAQPNDRSGP